MQNFNGDADALYEMGCAYEDAYDVKHDSAAAAVCFRTAAEKGHADAQCLLGRRVGCDFYDDESFLSMKLDGGCCSSCRAAMEAQFEIGAVYFEGDVVTVDKEKAEALEWWRKTAEQGCSKCRTRHGNTTPPCSTDTRQQQEQNEEGWKNTFRSI